MPEHAHARPPSRLDGRGGTEQSAGSRRQGAAPIHRTLPDYLDGFLDAGLRLTKMVDVDHPNVAARRASGEELPPSDQLPRFMVLAFAKP